MPSVKNILLVNPWIYDFAAYDFWMKPLGLLYMAAVLKQFSSCRLDFIDCLDRAHPDLKSVRPGRPDGRGSLPKEEVAKPLVLKDIPRRYSRYGIPVPLFRRALDGIPVPDLVLMTCMMTYWYPGVQAAAEELRAKFGSVPIALGGVYPTLMPEHAARHSGADIIVRGPGENRILPLVKEALGDGVAASTDFRALDELPRPAFGILRDRTWLPLLTSRGCPYTCSFCASRLLHQNFEQRKAASVVAEIENAFVTFGTRSFVFYDDALFLNKNDHLAPILKGVMDRRMEVTFHTPNGVHVREIDSRFARLLKRAGVASIFLSQESVDDELLSRRSPKVKAADLEKALDCLESAGYSRGEISVYLIAGLPGQNAESIRSAIERVKELKAVPRLADFSPIPGTAEWEGLVRKGILSEEADPLLHNKSVYPYLAGSIGLEEWAALRSLAGGSLASNSRDGTKV